MKQSSWPPAPFKAPCRVREIRTTDSKIFAVLEKISQPHGCGTKKKKKSSHEFHEFHGPDCRIGLRKIREIRGMFSPCAPRLCGELLLWLRLRRAVQFVANALGHFPF
jgi:hypothetical protein